MRAKSGRWTRSTRSHLRKLQITMTLCNATWKTALSLCLRAWLAPNWKSSFALTIQASKSNHNILHQRKVLLKKSKGLLWLALDVPNTLNRILQAHRCRDKPNLLEVNGPPTVPMPSPQSEQQRVVSELNFCEDSDILPSELLSDQAWVDRLCELFHLEELIADICVDDEWMDFSRHE